MIKTYVVTKNPMWELRDANCATIGKRANLKWQHDKISCSHPMWLEEKEYFKKCFLAEHSTIEVLEFRIIDDHCRGDVCNQIVRATKGLPRYQVQSSRPDWNGGAERKPSDKTFVEFSSYWNPLAFLQMCRQRLCMTAQMETRNWVKSVITTMKESGDPMLVALSECCVPQCVYRGYRCYEMKPCGMCDSGL